MTSYLCRLPNEVIVEFICLLAVEDIISLRMTCQKLYALTRLRCVWHTALHHHVIARGLSVPSPYPISGERYLAASSFDIESRTVHASRLHNNFTSEDPGPRVTRAVKIPSVVGDLDDIDPSERLNRISEVAFLNTASGHQYLVAAYSLYRLGCWEISPDGGSVYLVALWTSQHLIRRIRVNELSECLEHDSAQGLLGVACESEPGTFEVTILGLDRFRGCFLNLGTIDAGAASWLHFFRGPLLGLSEQPRVVHWQDDCIFRLYGEIVFPGDWNNTVDMSVLEDNSLLMVTHTSIELFLIPTNQAPCSISSLCAVARFNLPWRLLTIATAVTGYNLQTHCIRIPGQKPPRRQPLSVLVRSLDGGFHVIHHYVFDIETLQPDGKPPAIPIRFPPTHVRTIHILPSCGKICLSPSGRGCWLETRNVGPKTHSYPARCVVPLYINAVSTQLLAPDIPEEWQVDFNVGTKTLYERPCGWKDLVDGRQRISSVALDDSMGRIAIGDTDGCIVVLNYA
ncbi:hypothetical protein JB92DRAFT_280026 [Gautieria morchelliformis]|nr:hypothetical protein JB92DRAFT_280026 [Gautieria morchelliformis]